MSRVNIGIIGTGYTVCIAKQHLAAYKASERAEIKALYDIILGRAAEWAKKNGLEGTAICCSLDGMGV